MLVSTRLAIFSPRVIYLWHHIEAIDYDIINNLKKESRLAIKLITLTCSQRKSVNKKQRHRHLLSSRVARSHISLYSISNLVHVGMQPPGFFVFILITFRFKLRISRQPNVFELPFGNGIEPIRKPRHRVVVFYFFPPHTRIIVGGNWAVSTNVYGDVIGVYASFNLPHLGVLASAPE